MNAKHKGGLLLFLAFVGVGYLGGLTGTVATAPKYSPDIDRQPALVYNVGLKPTDQTPAPSGAQQIAGKESAAADSSKINTEIFSTRGCIQCHTVSALKVKGGETGPDLSNATVNVPNKYGKSLREFLDKPEGVMAEVLPTKNVTDKEKDQIVELLTKAVDQNGSQPSEI